MSPADIRIRLMATPRSANGGKTNIANGEYASVSGGEQNTANANFSSVTGGSINVADGEYSRSAVEL